MAQVPNQDKPPLWQRYLVIFSLSAAAAVAAGVFFMTRSAIELDREQIAQVAQETAKEEAASNADDHTASNSAKRDSSGASSLRVAGSASQLVEPEVAVKNKASAPAVQGASRPAAPGDVDSTTESADSAPERSDGLQPELNAATSPPEPPGISHEASKDVQAAQEPQTAVGANKDSLAADASTQPTPSAKEVTSETWLKLDDNGEPCEVTLDNGTKLKLETYGDEYEGYDYRPPITLYDPKLRKLIDFKHVHGHGNSVSGLTFDSKSNQMYWFWCVPPHQVGRILRADVNGRGITDLVTGLENVLGFAIDPQRKKMYWTERKSYVDSVKRASLDGSKIEDLVPGAEGAGIAVEPESGDVFYWTHEGTLHPSINRIKSDGSGEKEVINDSYKAPLTWQIVFEPASRKLYWRCADGSIRRANYDGSDAEFVVDAVGHGGGNFALDPGDQKVYWTSVSSMELCRANLDGSSPEVLVVSPPEHENPEHRDIGYVAFEPQHRRLYISWKYFDGPTAIGALSRMEVPPLPKPVKKPAPPWIENVLPPKQAAGGEVVLKGKGFDGASKVALFDDGNGHEVPTQFEARSDSELAFTMPKLSEGCSHAAVIVLTEGGVTVTIPTATSLARPNIWVGIPGTFDISTDFVTGKYANVWYVQGETKRLFNVHSQATKTWNGGGIKSLIYAENGSIVSTKERGNNVLFLKDGAITGMSRWRTVIYHEPFAVINNSFRKSAHETETTLVPVPAIRPSFVESLLEYEE